MTFWDFADKHIIFCGLMIFFIVFFIVCVIDNAFTNYFKSKYIKNSKPIKEDIEK
jgi:hypothetical protein